jgi:hypothetical protein
MGTVSWIWSVRCSGPSPTSFPATPHESDERGGAIATGNLLAAAYLLHLLARSVHDLHQAQDVRLTLATKLKQVQSPPADTTWRYAAVAHRYTAA